MKTFFLNVSELHITDENKIIKTILGSCVSVIFFIPRLKLSAVCHARLPQGKCLPTKRNGFCHTDSSILYMIDELKKRGAKEHEFIVKAFGGAQLIYHGSKQKLTTQSIGQKNTAMVKKVLANQGLQLTSYEFGGNSGRKLIYRTHKNEVIIKSLKEESCTENQIALLLKDFILKK